MNSRTLWLTFLCFTAITVRLTAEEPQPSIAVRGSAKLELPADGATITIQLEGRAMDADKAYEKVEKQTQAIVSLLNQNGVVDPNVRLQPIMIISYETRQANDKGKLLSSNRNQQAVQKQSANNQEDEDVEITAYQATRRLIILVTNLSRLNTIHLGLVKNGVKRIERLEFTSSKSTEEYAKLRQAAVREALAKAKAMADELGAEVASIKSIVDQSSPLAVATNVTPTSSSDPFGLSSKDDEGSTIIRHVASVNVVFRLGKTELSK